MTTLKVVSNYTSYNYLAVTFQTDWRHKKKKNTLPSVLGALPAWTKWTLFAKRGIQTLV